MRAYRYTLGTMILVTAVLLALTPLVSLQAQDTLLMSYQGQLLNSSGDPLTGTYNLTFRLYSAQTGSTSLWNETHSNVPVTNGLFSVVLGSHITLPNSLLDGTSRYLGVTVGYDTELSPRTLLTSAPNAALAGKVIGDISIGNGSLMLKTDNGDSSIVLFNRGFGPHIMMFDPQPEPPGHPLIDISGDGTLGPSIVMFDPQPEPPGKMFEIIASAGNGPSMSFFDQGGQVMGVEPSPFNGGFSLMMLNPQAVDQEKMFEISTSYASSKSTAMRFYGAPLVGGGSQEVMTFTAMGTDANLRMGLGAPTGSSNSYISMLSDASTSTLTLIGPAGPLATSPITMFSSLASTRLGIGTSSPTQSLHVEGNIYLTGMINYPSDLSFKKDIRVIDNPLSAIEHINGVTYAWKSDQFPERHFDSKRQVGLIAQEVAEVLPEAVTLQDDGYYTIDYSRVTPLLLEAIKALKKQNEQLTKRIEALEEKKH